MQAVTAGTKLIADNRRARHEYHLLDRYEAGLALTGTEVKSLRDGKAMPSVPSVTPRRRGLPRRPPHPRVHAGHEPNHDPDRDRKLLLHRREIDQLTGKVQEKGLTLVPRASTGRTGAPRSSSRSPAGRTCATSGGPSPTATRSARWNAPRAAAATEHDRVDDSGEREEGGHRPERHEAVGVQIRVGREQPDDENAGRDRAPHGRRERDGALGRRSGERPLDDRERDEGGAEKLRVEGRLGEREPEEVVERVPGGGEQEERERRSRPRRCEGRAPG